MDESGCLGFDFSKKGTSNYFIVTFLFSERKRPLEKLVSKTFLSIPEKQRLVHPGVLHANSEKPLVRRRLLEGLVKIDDVGIIALRLNKKRVYTHLQNEKTILYNYVTNILLDRIHTRKLLPLDQPITFIAAQRETNRFLNENFRNYLHVKHNHTLNINVRVSKPSQEKGLQVVDFASWALFRNYEHHDSSYRDIFSKIIIEESLLFGQSI